MTITKIKNSIDCPHSPDQSEERMSGLEDRSVEIIQSEEQTEQNVNT